MHIWTRINSPIGTLVLIANRDGITHLLLPGQQAPALVGRELAPSASTVRAWTDQINDYFDGTRKQFELPLALSGTPFQLQVYAELQKIPHGQTRSYGQVAAALGRPRSGRAVGAANGRNPIPVIVPCHRVVAAAGGLGGYAGGKPMKRWLLEHEAGQRAQRLA